jgi:hypothetical protein
MQLYPYILTGAVMLGACTRGKDEATLLKEAAGIHNEAIQTAVTLEGSLQILVMDTALQDSAKVYIEAIETWKEDLVEVPGNEADHHDHHHHHESAGNYSITATEMVAVQKALKVKIDSIAERVHRFRGK